MAATASRLAADAERGSPSALAKLFHDLLEHAGNVAVIALQPDGTIASWNGTAERLFRLPFERAIGRDFASLYGADAAASDRPRQNLDAAFEQRSTSESGVLLARADGSLFRANLHLGAIVDRDGTHLGFVALLQGAEDVAEAPRRFAELLSEADLVLSSVSDTICVQDANGRMVYVNGAAARIFGFEDGQSFLDTPLEEAITELELFDEDGNAIDAYRFIVSCGDTRDWGGRAIFYSRTRGTNESRWMLVRQARTYGARGELQLVVTVGTDVSDTIRTKQSVLLLSETTARLSSSLDYETTLANLTDALVPRLADWVGVIQIEATGPRPVALASTNPELATQLRERWQGQFHLSPALAAVLHTGEAQFFENLTPEKLGAFALERNRDLITQTRIQSMIVAPIVVAERIIGLLIAGTVASKRPFDHGDLALIREIGRRAGTAIEHTRLYREAQRAIQIRNEFLALAAHELRTPLASLTLQLHSLRAAFADDASSTDLERLRGRLDKTIRQNGRLTRLVDNVLDVSQIASGRLELRRREIDLSTVVQATCDRLADDVRREDTTLSLTTSGPCVGCWDAERLDQVVANLLSNAIKYGRRRPIEVCCTCEDRNAVVTVTDHGIGIAPENLDRIFGRFERAVPEQHYGGLGLGLWMSQEIVGAHGGRIEVASTVGAGTVFRLVLPLGG
jgi:PAS domain S-box-containing protein